MRARFFLKRLLRDNRGATAVEYGLIVALIVIAILGALRGVANENTGLWAVITDRVETNM
jgi:pilus assembly protein Flp/PilA